MWRVARQATRGLGAWGSSARQQRLAVVVEEHVFAVSREPVEMPRALMSCRKGLSDVVETVQNEMERLWG